MRRPLKSRQHDDIAECFAGEHRAACEPDVAAHQAEYDGDGLADGGQEREEGHHRPAPCEKPAGLVQLFLLYAQPGDPFALAERADPITAHAAQRIARCRGDDAQHGVQPHVHQYEHHGFGTERHDAAGDQRREEKAPVAPVDQKLRECLHASCPVLCKSSPPAGQR